MIPSLRNILIQLPFTLEIILRSKVSHIHHTIVQNCLSTSPHPQSNPRRFLLLHASHPLRIHPGHHHQVRSQRLDSQPPLLHPLLHHHHLLLNHHLLRSVKPEESLTSPNTEECREKKLETGVIVSQLTTVKPNFQLREGRNRGSLTKV